MIMNFKFWGKFLVSPVHFQLKKKIIKRTSHLSLFYSNKNIEYTEYYTSLKQYNIMDVTLITILKVMDWNLALTSKIFRLRNYFHSKSYKIYKLFNNL